MRRTYFDLQNWFFTAFCFIMIIALPLSGFNISVAEELNQAKICAQVLTMPFPVNDRPSSTETQELKGCDSDKLYYGYEKAGDPVKARKCAYLEMGPPENSDGPVNSMRMLFCKS